MSKNEIASHAKSVREINKFIQKLSLQIWQKQLLGKNLKQTVDFKKRHFDIKKTRQNKCSNIWR